MLRPREELEKKLIEPTLSVKRSSVKSEKVKQHLFNANKILEGNTQTWINNPRVELPRIQDDRILALFSEQIHAQTKDESINPKNYFTEVELKKSQQFSGALLIDDEIEFPFTIQNVIMVDRDCFVCTLDVEAIAKLSKKLNYNFDIQREAKKVIRKGEIIKIPKLNMENVLEIKHHLHKGTLVHTNMVYNAAVRTADEGDELKYNKATRELTIMPGTRLDIVDGYHRSKACELAWNEDKNIEFKFILTFLNYTDDNAAIYQGQLAKATPVSKERQKELESSRMSDLVMKELTTKSELKGKISTDERISHKQGELVKYDTLASSIEECFKLKKMVDVYNVSDYLKVYFDMLLGTFAEDFIDNVLEAKKVRLMNDPNMFVGYVALAAKMYYGEVEPKKVVKYLQGIDFSRKNPEWKELGLESETRWSMRSRRALQKNIREFFENIEL